MFMFCKVASGRLLRVWPAHYKAVSCLVFSEDDSLLISGADDGLVNVWPLLRSPHLAVELIFMFFSLKHLDLSENVNNIQKAWCVRSTDEDHMDVRVLDLCSCFKRTMVLMRLSTWPVLSGCWTWEREEEEEEKGKWGPCMAGLTTHSQLQVFLLDLVALVPLLSPALLITLARWAADLLYSPPFLFQGQLFSYRVKAFCGFRQFHQTGSCL